MQEDFKHFKIITFSAYKSVCIFKSFHSPMNFWWYPSRFNWIVKCRLKCDGCLDSIWTHRRGLFERLITSRSTLLLSWSYWPRDVHIVADLQVVPRCVITSMSRLIYTRRAEQKARFYFRNIPDFSFCWVYNCY